MSKEKENQSYFDSISFENEDIAKNYLKNCEKTHKIKMIFTGISLLSTLGYFLVMGLIQSDFFMGLGAVMILAGFVSAFIVNGVGALKFPIKCAKFFWFIIPIFPVDIAFGLIGIIVGVMGLFFIPIVVCLSGVAQSKRNCKAAREYLALNGISV